MQALLFVAIVLATLLLFLSIVAGPPKLNLQFWDDAYMFARYADNLRATGRLSWNPGGEPTYGLTSVLYAVAVVLPARLAIPSNAAVAVVCASMVCMTAFVGLALALAWRASEGASRLVRAAVVLTVVASLSAARAQLNEHATSGMDTAFAMAFVTVYLLAALRNERSDTTLASAVGLGAFGGLAVGVRPDLMLFTLAVPLAMLALGARPKRRGAGVTLAVTIGVCGLWLGACQIYFQSALPLSFYAKATGLYRDFNRDRYAAIPLVQLVDFCRANGVLVALTVIGTVQAAVDRRSRSPVVTGALVASLLFVAYYLTTVLQIMYHAARFYYPVLPALVLVGADAATRLFRRASESERWRRAPVFAVVALAVVVAPGLSEARRAFAGVRELDVWDSARTLYRRRWFALEAFSRLPDDLVIATTEVGHVGAMNPNKTIVDYAGLNDIAFARAPFTADRLLARKPDVLYLPHTDYRGMLADILASEAFRTDYVFHPADELHATLGLALRRDSTHYEEMAEIVATTEDEDAAKAPPAKPAR
jgi:hypothetical protein